MYPFYEDRGTELHCRRRKRLMCAKHLHDHIEMVVMIKGKVTTHVGNRSSVLEGGNAFIAFPNQVHFFSDDYGEFDSVLFIFPPNIIPDFYKSFLNHLPKSPIIPLDMEVLLPVLQIALQERYHPSNFSDIVIKNCLSIILTHLLRNAELEPIDDRHMSAVQAILRYCGQHYTEDVTLETIAQNTHMSKYYISHLFSKEIGISFPEYINTLRIRDAEKLLKSSDMSITEVAFSVGFNSLRSFNRHFFAQTGMTPRQVKSESKFKK